MFLFKNGNISTMKSRVWQKCSCLSFDLFLGDNLSSTASSRVTWSALQDSRGWSRGDVIGDNIMPGAQIVDHYTVKNKWSHWNCALCLGHNFSHPATLPVTLKTSDLYFGRATCLPVKKKIYLHYADVVLFSLFSCQKYFCVFSFTFIKSPSFSQN